MTEFEKVGLEICKFMRGKYELDEGPGMYYDFQIILGKAEREKFEVIKHEFTIEIQELYDKERTLHDGKWLLIRVDNLRAFEAVKKLILIKKKPNFFLFVW